MTDSNLFVDAGTGKWLPVVTNTHKSDYLRRDRENEDSRKAKAAVFVQPQIDQVIITSRYQDNNLPVRKNYLACHTASQIPGPVKSACESVTARKLVAPYGDGANQNAIRRYGEASTLSSFNTSTFEILV